MADFFPQVLEHSSIAKCPLLLCRSEIVSLPLKAASSDEFLLVQLTRPHLTVHALSSVDVLLMRDHVLFAGLSIKVKSGKLLTLSFIMAEWLSIELPLSLLSFCS